MRLPQGTGDSCICKHSNQPRALQMLSKHCTRTIPGVHFIVNDNPSDHLYLPDEEKEALRIRLTSKT
jgi:hypothetical protein